VQGSGLAVGAARRRRTSQRVSRAVEAERPGLASGGGRSQARGHGALGVPRLRRVAVLWARSARSAAPTGLRPPAGRLTQDRCRSTCRSVLPHLTVRQGRGTPRPVGQSPVPPPALRSVRGDTGDRPTGLSGNRVTCAAAPG
jgi:hypothetical protein